MNQIVQIRQIAQYPEKNPVFPDDLVVLQEFLGGPVRSTRMSSLVSTALSLIDEQGQTFDLKLQPGRGLSWEGGLDATLVWEGGKILSGSTIVAPSFEAAEMFTIGGRMVATIDDVNAVAAHNVQSFNGRFGHILLGEDDVKRAGAAPIRDAHFCGWITAPSLWDTRADDDTVATVNWVHRAIHETGVSSFNGRHGCVQLTTQDISAATASAPPGVYPTAPTPAPGDASSKIATTLFVDDALADLHLIISDEQLALLTKEYAPLDSPQFVGVPSGPTANQGTATGQLATTAFVMNAILDSTTGVASFNTRTGSVTLSAADVVAAGGAPVMSPAFTGAPTGPTATPGTNSAQLATCAFVTAALLAAAGVASFNGRLGAVTLTGADIVGAGGAPIASPAFVGTPSAVTATPGTSTTQLATTAFVAAAVVAATAGVSSFNGRNGAVTLTGVDISSAGGALTASPSFTGTPLAPTAVQGTSNTQIATTAFVVAALASVAAGVSSFNGRTGAVTLVLSDVTATNVLVDSPLTGTPTAPTAAFGTSTGQLATTAFVAAAVASVSVPGVSSFNTRTGAVTLGSADVSAAGGALLASPSFSGTPLAPTAVPGTSTTQLATTAFVMAALTASAVTSFNGRSGVVTLSAADVGTAGAVLKTGDAMTGALSINTGSGADANLILNKVASGRANQIVGETAGSVRWVIIPGTADSETGSNVGSNFLIERFSDGGVLLDSPLTIARATGVAAFASTPTAPVNAADYTTNATPGKVLTTGAVWAAAGRVFPSDASGTITLDFNTGFDFWITLTGSGRTIANPINAKQGQKGIIIIQQPSGGNCTVNWPTAFKFTGTVKPVLSTAGNAVDVISYYCADSSPWMACSFQANFG